MAGTVLNEAATNRRQATLDRRDVMGQLLSARGDALIVTGLGSTTYDAGTQDHRNTFYLWGAMGSAAMVGLGLALSQPDRRVVVITGDGEMLMGMGSLATIGAEAPGNLALVVIDNEHYSETGMQPTHTGRGVSLSGLALACSFTTSRTIYGADELRDAIAAIYAAPGPVLFDVKVNTQRYPLSIRLRDGARIKDRFRENLLGQRAFD